MCVKSLYAVAQILTSGNFDSAQTPHKPSDLLRLPYFVIVVIQHQPGVKSLAKCSTIL